MENAVKFLFDEPFDEPEVAPDPTGPAADAGLSNEKVEELKAKAFEDGRQQGLEEAKSSIEATIAAAVAEIGTNVQRLFDDRAEIEAGLHAEAARLAHTIATKLAPKLMEAHPLAEIERLTSECLKALHGEPRLVVRLHESLVDNMKARVDALAAAAGYEGHVVLLADEALGPLDCRVEWANGGAEQRLDTVRADIDAAVERYLTTQTETAALAAAGETTESPAEDTAEASGDEPSTDTGPGADAPAESVSATPETAARAE